MKQGLILGIGNLLLGDEGIGPRVVEQIEQEGIPSGWDVLDGGTGGFHLLSCFRDYQTIILVDASMDDYEEGTIRILKPKYVTDFPSSLSAHDIGLHDLIQSARLLGYSPEIYLMAISIKDLGNLSDQLSDRTNNAKIRACRELRRLVAELEEAEVW